MGLLLSLSALIVGCATPLPQIEREAIASAAIEASPQTTLGRIVQNSLPEPGLSGFRLMPRSTVSLDTRVQLARRAESSLDLHY